MSRLLPHIPSQLLTVSMNYLMCYNCVIILQRVPLVLPGHFVPRLFPGLTCSFLQRLGCHRRWKHVKGCHQYCWTIEKPMFFVAWMKLFYPGLHANCRRVLRLHPFFVCHQYVHLPHQVRFVHKVLLQLFQ